MKNPVRKISIMKACVHGDKLQVEYTVTVCTVRSKQSQRGWLHVDFVELSSIRIIDLASLALPL